MTENNQPLSPELEPRLADTMKETDRKCPSCGATMDFDPASGGLSCAYCGYKEEIKSVEENSGAASELDFLSANEDSGDWGAEKKLVICKSCGAEAVYDALAFSDTCPYCGSNNVTAANSAGTMAPGGVVLFKITRERASECFMGWLKGKLFCPSAAKRSAQPDAFKGMYLPCWTFDAQTDSVYTARYGIDYREVVNGQTTTRTDWKKTSGEYSAFINDETVIATTRYDTAMLGNLLPYATEDNRAYKAEYVSGFFAERYSLGLKDAWGKAVVLMKSKLTSGVSSKIRSQYNADRVENVVLKTSYSNITFKYLLLPVWMSSFNYNGKQYNFMVNGQNGKVSGHAPISALRVAIAIAIVVAVIGLISICSGGESSSYTVILEQYLSSLLTVI